MTKEVEKKQASISLDDLNVVDQCDAPFEFEYLDDDGEQTRIFLTVIGGHSEKVKKVLARKVNDRRREDKLNESRGKNPKLNTIEDDVELMISSAAARLVGYRGITQDYTSENALKLVTINPLIRMQVIAESNKMANFTTNK